jgi:hypothetical protein
LWYKIGYKSLDSILLGFSSALFPEFWRISFFKQVMALFGRNSGKGRKKVKKENSDFILIFKLFGYFYTLKGVK